MKQKDLDKLKAGIDPELQDLLGDADELGIDDSRSPNTDPLDELLTGINPTGSVAKASFDAEFSDYLLGDLVDGGLDVDNADEGEHSLSLVPPVNRKSAGETVTMTDIEDHCISLLEKSKSPFSAESISEPFSEELWPSSKELLRAMNRGDQYSARKALRKMVRQMQGSKPSLA